MPSKPVSRRTYVNRRKPKFIVRDVLPAESTGRTSEARPPSTVWREVWFDTTPDGNALVMNAAIFRNDGQLTGEFHVFWNGERLSQLDYRSDEEQDRTALEALLIEKANVILRRVGLLPVIESKGWSNLRVAQ